MKKIIRSKTAKGITGFVVISMLLMSALMFASGNNTGITANVVAGQNHEASNPIEVKEIASLSQLNEGWYETRSGHIFYLKDFDTAIPLYVKVKDLQQQNGMFVVDSYGNIEHRETNANFAPELAEKTATDKEMRSAITGNAITGNAIGLESITGMPIACPATLKVLSKSFNLLQSGNCEYSLKNGNSELRGKYDEGSKKITITSVIGTYYPKALKGAEYNPDAFGPADSPQNNLGTASSLVDKNFMLEHPEIVSQLNQGDKLETDSAGRYTITKKTTPTGKKGQTRTTILTFNNDGSSNSVSIFETKNSRGEVTSYRTTGKRIQQISGTEKLVNIASEYKKKDGKIDFSSADYTEIATDSATGEPLSVTMKVNGVTSTAKYENGQIVDGNGQVLSEGTAKDELEGERSSYSRRKALFNAEIFLTQFQGLGYIPSLLFPDKMAEWRNNVDKFFSENYLGAEYLASRVCEGSLVGKFNMGLGYESVELGAGNGRVYSDTNNDIVKIAAHVEATRTKPIQSETGTVYIYQVTFAVGNGDSANDQRAPEEMNINVYARNSAKNSKLFKSDIEIKRGSSFGRAGSTAIIRQSIFLYDKVCIKFDNVPGRWRNMENKELCNSVQEANENPESLEMLRKKIETQQQNPQIAPNEPEPTDDW